MGWKTLKVGGIQLEALYAERIKDGKLTGEVYSPVIVTGYVPDILNSISMVSNQLEINGLGMCGKGHKEWVKVTDGGPHFKTKSSFGLILSVKRLISLLLVVLFIAALVALGSFGYTSWFGSGAEQWVRKGTPFGILFIGEDTNRQGLKKVIFVSVAVINPKLSRVGFISFLPKIKINKDIPNMEELIISNNGIQKVKEVVAQIISLEIPFFVQFTIDDIIQAIDLLEGLPYFLSNSDMLKGEQLPTNEFFLDGSIIDPLLNIHVNHEYASAYQIDRYHSLILNMWELRKKKWGILQEKIIFDQAISNIRKNFSNKELFSITKLFFSNEHWLPLFFEMPLRKEKNLYLLNKEAAAIHYRDFLATLTQEKNKIFEKPPSIEVRNGTNVHSLAKKVGSELTRKGFQVFEFTNADHHNYKETILLDVSGKFFYLKSVAGELNIDRYYHAVDRTQFTDLVLILGKDFSKKLFDLKRWQ